MLDLIHVDNGMVFIHVVANVVWIGQIIMPDLLYNIRENFFTRI